MPDSSWLRGLVDRLVSDAAPVRRLWSPEARLVAWLGLVVVTLAVAASRTLRPDLMTRLEAPDLLLEELAVALGAGLVALAALRAAVPGRSLGRGGIWLAALAFGLALLLVLRAPVHAWPYGLLELGLPCILRSVAWAALPLAALFVALRRGAALAPARAGALAGAAAFGFASLAVRICCQLDEAVHLLLFHAGPVAAGTVGSAVLGALVLARRRPSTPAL